MYVPEIPFRPGRSDPAVGQARPPEIQTLGTPEAHPGFAPVCRRNGHVRHRSRMGLRQAMPVETDFLWGFLPKKYAGEKTRLTFTVKQNYIPWSISFDPRWTLEPFYCGLYVTTITGDEFWKESRENIPTNTTTSAPSCARTSLSGSGSGSTLRTTCCGTSPPITK